MASILIYILQVNILLGFIYFGYVLLLRGLTFYRLNRIYFLVGSVYALMYPFIDIGGWIGLNMHMQVPAVLDYIYFDGLEGTINLFTLDRLLVGLIVLVGGAFLIQFVIRLSSLVRVHFYSFPSQWQGFRFRNVVFPIVPFSFFNKIYMHRAQHEEPELYNIFKHEYIHVKGLHTLDILWFEMLSIGCWYNPFVWLMRKTVRQNLEFLTDQQVLDKGMDRQTYQYSLLHVTQQGVAVGVSNHFNFKSLKKRIMMMNKRRSSKLELSKYAFWLPILIVAGASFTVSKAEEKIEEIVQSTENIVLDVKLPDREPRVENRAVQDTTKKLLIVEALPISTSADSTKKGLQLHGPQGTPLYILDGKEISPDTFAKIDPNTIESIDILKNTSAVAQYGDKGKNGVISIRLKTDSEEEK